MTKNRTSKVGLDSAGNARGSGYVDCKDVRASHGNNYDRRLEGGKPRSRPSGEKWKNVNGRDNIARRFIL